MAESSERPGLFRRFLGKSPDEEKVRTARFPLQAYGKLPIYKDFISVGLTDPAAREFRQWIDRGFSYRWAENEDYREAEIPQHVFLLRLPESKACVAGSLWGSSDQGGLRRFPFVAFLSFAAAQPAADPLAAVHYLSAFERRCEEIRDGYAAGASLAAFYKAYRGSEFECAIKTREQGGKELREALGDFPLSDYAESLFGARALARWPSFVAELEHAVAGPDGPGAIRLPLSGVMPRSREIAFWLRWIDRFEAKRRRPVLGVLYSSGRGPGRAVVFYRDLAPEDFLLLHPTHGGHPQVRDIGAPERVEVPPPADVLAIPQAKPAAPAPEPPSGPPAALVQEAAVPQPAAAAAPAPELPSVPPAALVPEAAVPQPAAPELEAPMAVEPAAVPATPPAQAADVGEQLPFPEAEDAPEAAGRGPRETFSALELFAASPPLPSLGAEAETQAPVERPPVAPAQLEAVVENEPVAAARLETVAQSAPVAPAEPEGVVSSDPVVPSEASVPSEQPAPPPEPERPAPPPVPSGWDRPLCALLGL